MAEKMFPIQVNYRDRDKAPFPTQVPWSVAEKAWSTYQAQYGTGQSLERMAERGGFSPGEMDMFHPKWREECEEIPRLKTALSALLKRYKEVHPEMVPHWPEWTEARKALGETP